MACDLAATDVADRREDPLRKNTRQRGNTGERAASVVNCDSVTRLLNRCAACLAGYASGSICVAYASEEAAMDTERHVRLFKNGRNQALRIPRDLELPGHDAILRKEGRRLVVEPVARPSLLAVLATLKPLDEDFPRIESLPAEPADL